MSHQDFLNYFDEYGATLVLFARQYVQSEMDAEGIVQDAFIKLWKRGISPDYPIKQQLYLQTKCAALDFLRSEKRRKVREETYATENTSEYHLFEAPVERQEAREELERAMANLSEEQREVLVMKVWGELTFKEISNVLEISQGTAASRYRLAVENLRRIMDKESVYG